MCNMQIFFSFLGSLKVGHFFWQKLQTYLSSATCHTKMSLFISRQALSKIYRRLGLFPLYKTSLYKQEKVSMSSHWRNLIVTLFFPLHKGLCFGTVQVSHQASLMFHHLWEPLWFLVFYTHQVTTVCICKEQIVLYRSGSSYRFTDITNNKSLCREVTVAR